MLILYLTFITIPTVFTYCVNHSDLVVSEMIQCTDDAIVIDCQETGFLSPDQTDCFRYNVVVLRFKNCSSSNLLHFGGMFMGSIRWASLEPNRNMLSLIADHNELDTLLIGSLTGAEKHKYLDLSYNQFENIESIKEAGVAALETLIISHNMITAIGETTFKDFNDLRVLDMSSNNLTTIGDGTFDLIPDLVKLSMAHNSLSFLDFGMFTHLRAMESIDIYGIMFCVL